MILTVKSSSSSSQEKNEAPFERNKREVLSVPHIIISMTIHHEYYSHATMDKSENNKIWNPFHVIMD